MQAYYIVMRKFVVLLQISLLTVGTVVAGLQARPSTQPAKVVAKTPAAIAQVKNNPVLSPQEVNQSVVTGNPAQPVVMPAPQPHQSQLANVVAPDYSPVNTPEPAPQPPHPT